jgi:hypothetical protein
MRDDLMEIVHPKTQFLDIEGRMHVKGWSRKGPEVFRLDLKIFSLT